MNELHYKYLQLFLGVKDCIEKNLQEKVSDVKLSIHATTSTQQLIHKGHLNIPKVEEIATYTQVMILALKNIKGMYCFAIETV